MPSGETEADWLFGKALGMLLLVTSSPSSSSVSSACPPRSGVPLSVAVLLALSAPSVAAESGSAADVVEPLVDPDPRGTFSFILDNDLFGDTDRYYTNGFQFAWRSATDTVPAWLAVAGRATAPVLPPGGVRRWGLAFGQEIYTPEDIFRDEPDPADRPYAAWLYGAVSYSVYTDTSFAAAELQAGVVGPSALGEQVQNTVHAFNGGDLAEGWDAQLDDEPGLNLLFTRLWRYDWALDPEAPRGYAVGIVPSLDASLGNVRTHAGAGLLVRAGRNLGADFGPPRIRPSVGGSAFVQPEGRWGWYVFASAQGRAVVRDIFLDGNSFADGPRVDRKPLVAEGSLGAALVFPAGRLSYAQTFRSEEFVGQETSSEFGSITLTLRF